MAKLNQAMSDLLRYNNAIIPQKRSSFDKSHSHATTLDSGWLVPVMYDRVVPGDEKKIRFSGLARMATPLHPTMDEAYLYTWAFYVPDRLWWTHARNFYGENLDASFNPDGEYIMPYLTPDQYFVNSYNGTGQGSLNDYFGMPISHTSQLNNRTYDVDHGVCAGLWRSYQLIWNEYFRNSSVQPALQLNDGDEVTESEWSVIKQLRKVNKLPDMFTSLLREPQAGADVLLPLGDYAPVVTLPETSIELNTEHAFLRFVNADGSPYDSEIKHLLLSQSNSLQSGEYESGVLGDVKPVVPSNLWTSLADATSASINNLRMAITVQQLLEIDAIGGKRYQNLLYAHFGTFTPDATLQRPELLGLCKERVGMRQVLQTSATADGSTPLGNASAVSVTNVNNEWICNKAFTEPGYIIVLASVRPLHSYSQGINPLLRKLNRYDHYYPVFDNIGNQPVYVSEIYGKFNSNANVFDSRFSKVFGWKEAWQEYRMMDNRVSGLFRPDADGSLASWNYSTNLTAEPILNSAFIEEDPNLIDRTIAVQSEPQFLLDCYFEYFDTKNMSVHSTPGLTRL